MAESTTTANSRHRNGGAPVRPTQPIPIEQVDQRSTPERLLDAAEYLFAERGFADTSVRDLTGAAECNIASVNYHFGSKDNLYVEVFRRALGEMREDRLRAIEAAAADGLTTESLVRAFAESFIQPLMADPARGDRLMQLYSREMAQPLLPEDMFHREMFEPVSEAMAEAMQRLYPGIDAFRILLVLVSLGGQLVHLVQMNRCFLKAGIPVTEQIDLEAAVDHIVAFSTAGIEATAQVKGSK